MTANLPESGVPPIPPRRGPARRLPVFPVMLGAGIVAAAIAGGLGEAAANWFPAVAPGDPSLGPLGGGAVTNESADQAVVKNGALTYALLGGVLGLAFGLAGGLIARSPRHGAVAAIEGAVVGVLLGAGVSLGLFPAFFQKFDRLSDDLILPMVTHGAVWCLIGASAGAAFGIGSGGGAAGVGRAALGGLAGAALATVLYEVLGAFAFPSDKTTMPLAASAGARLLAQAGVCVLSALGVAFVAAEPSPARS